MSKGFPMNAGVKWPNKCKTKAIGKANKIIFECFQSILVSRCPNRNTREDLLDEISSKFCKINLSHLRLIPDTCYCSKVGTIDVRILSLSKKYTYLLTPWCRVLLEKLTGLQLVKKFPAFHGTGMFITALTSLRHLSLSWASPIQSIYPHPTSWRSILILSTQLHLRLPSGLLLSGFPTKTLYTPLS